MHLVSWLRRHDPGFAALRRAGRTAIIMPAMFAIGVQVLDNPTLATFAAFGSFAQLLLVDFGGPMRQRVQAHLALGVTGAGLVCLGTLASRSAGLAAVSMAVVGFAVLFAGVVSSVLAGAGTALLLAFILPVTQPGPVSSIPDRLLGWGLASVVALVAIVVLWPARSETRCGARRSRPVGRSRPGSGPTWPSDSAGWMRRRQSNTSPQSSRVTPP